MPAADSLAWKYTAISQWGSHRKIRHAQQFEELHGSFRWSIGWFLRNQLVHATVRHDSVGRLVRLSHAHHQGSQSGRR